MQTCRKCVAMPERGQTLCKHHLNERITDEDVPSRRSSDVPMSELYPQYYKPVGNLTELDVYAVHMLFDIQDPSGAIQHASKKLLLSGKRTGGKSMVKDIREARDALNRWLQLHPEKDTPGPVPGVLPLK